MKKEERVGSERDRAIAEAVRAACDGVEDPEEMISDDDLDAIIAAVEAQHPAPPRLFDVWEGGYVHYTRPEGDPLLDEARKRPGYSVRPHERPAPALPRDVAMRIAEEVLHTTGLAAIGKGPPADLDAIVSRHLPTDEEREAERAVVEAALVVSGAPLDSDPDGPVQAAWGDFDAACARLLASRAKRGAR